MKKINFELKDFTIEELNERIEVLETLVEISMFETKRDVAKANLIIFKKELTKRESKNV